MAPRPRGAPPPPGRALRGDLPVVVGALAGGLMASSCCLVQLALNSLSVGCAGLSVFKPYRSLLRLATAAMLGALLLRSGLNRRTLGTLVCSLLLTFSEDAVSAVNRAGSVRALLTRAGLLPRAAAPPSPPPPLVRWRVEVQGMRCQACAARVRGSVAALPGVRNATVELGAGRVEVWAEPGAPLSGGALAAAIRALDPGYAVGTAGRECFAAEGGARVDCGGGEGAGGGGSSGGSSCSSGGSGSGGGGSSCSTQSEAEPGALPGQEEALQGGDGQQRPARRRPGPAATHDGEL
ncbi:hypothetical protein Rsub_02255 [Raphidocelis subcapitata]|uniref:HMA domain-containing protein n=1 Tax=Raphidocelis subcapitata TaxID=307507 RepID=A0A2V0NX92_9CHLO|nr:hypothetical protein Rsub_02255 [Raphidocelis subcapitata]|eukprot:GBF89537.1 hypothetical protein Rsub_02255 [Raphidocelis subcapitata]